MAKIRIVSSKKSDNWYADLIGQTFEVIEGDYGVNRFKVKREVGDNWFVHSLDAERLEESVQEEYKLEFLAVRRAKELSTIYEVMSVIESKGKFYVENDVPLIRSWERLICTYENGKNV